MTSRTLPLECDLSDGQVRIGRLVPAPDGIRCYAAIGDDEIEVGIAATIREARQMIRAARGETASDRRRRQRRKPPVRPKPSPSPSITVPIDIVALRAAMGRAGCSEPQMIDVLRTVVDEETRQWIADAVDEKQSRREMTSRKRAPK
jgi:hypothetical protein